MARGGLLAKLVSIGIATRRYPYERVEPPEGFRGKIVVDPQKCVGCGACARVCPARAISIEDDEERGIRRIAIFYGRCIFCARCVDVCPLNAVSTTKEFELASNESNDLLYVVEHPMARCILCGKPFAPQKLVAYVARSMKEETRWLAMVCPECRSRIVAKVKSFVGW